MTARDLIESTVGPVPSIYAAEIGPRVVGGRYHSGYWGEDYEVLAIRTDVPVWGWEMTVRWSDGHRTTHSTAWSTRLRDKVLD